MGTRGWAVTRRRAGALFAALALLAATLLAAGAPDAAAQDRSLSLEPPADTNEPGSDHTVVATLTQDGAPEPGVKLAFDVVAGPNQDQSSAGGGCQPTTCDTDANGQVSWTYSSNNQEGQDTIVAVVAGDNSVAAPTVLKTWTKTRDKNPITDRWPDLTAAEEQAVQTLISANRRADALAELVKAMTNHCCSFATMEGGRPIYEANLANRGGNDVATIERRAGGKLWIGPGAFEALFDGDTTPAVSRLYSVLKAAMVHSQQWQDPGAATAQGALGRERQATQLERANTLGTDVNDRYAAYLTEKDRSLALGREGVENPRLKAELFPSKRLYRPGEPVLVTMLVRNIASESLILNDRLNAADAAIPGDLREVFFSVKAPNGALLSMQVDQNATYAGAADFKTVTPNNFINRVIDLGALFPMTAEGVYEVCGNYENALVGPMEYDAARNRMAVRNIGAQLARNETPCVNIEVRAFDADNVGLVEPDQARWYLRNSAGQQTVFFFGNPGDVPVAGDWNGDGTTTIGMYRPSDGFFYARNSNSQGVADFACFAGNPDDEPMAGDWDGDGTETLGLYRPNNQTFFLFNKVCNNTPMGAAAISFVFGDAGDRPFAGDFDDDGRTEVALHRASTGLVYYRNTPTTGNADASFIWGNPADRVLAGDWNADGRDTVGLFRPGDTRFYLRNSNTAGPADVSFQMGVRPWLPVAGDWGLG